MEFEIVNVPEVQMLPEESRKSIMDSFWLYFQQAERYKEQALAINVTSIDQSADMKKARELRLMLKDVRCNAENTRKSLKEESLRKGKAIDGMANVIKFLIEPVEEHLEKQEKFAELALARVKAELNMERKKELSEFVELVESYGELGNMPDSTYSALLEWAKKSKRDKEEAERVAEAERIEKQKFEAEEREAMRMENERLKKEAEEREREFEKLKAVEATIRREAEEKSRIEREAREKAEAELAKKRMEERMEQERLLEEAAKRVRMEKEKAYRDWLSKHSVNNSMIESWEIKILREWSSVKMYRLVDSFTV